MKTEQIYWLAEANLCIREFFGVGDCTAAVYNLAKLRNTNPDHAGAVLAEFVAHAMAYAYKEAKLEMTDEELDSE